MKKKILMLTVFALVCALILPLGSCTEQNPPDTIEPNTSDIPQTPQPELTQENIAEMFLPAFECYISYMGSQFYTVEKDDNGQIKLYTITDDKGVEYDAYKVVEYSEFEPIADKMREYLTQRGLICSLLDGGIYEERDGALYIQMPKHDEYRLMRLDSVFDINSITLGEEYDDGYKVYINTGNAPQQDIITDYIYEEHYYVKMQDGRLYIDRPGVTWTPASNNINPEYCEWIGPLYKLYGQEPQYLDYIYDSMRF